MFVFSPSNMSTFMQCPRKFQAQSITKEIKWQATQQKSRGTLIHNCMERALQKGYDDVSSWPEGMDMDFVKRSVDAARTVITQSGVELYIEHELTVTDRWAQTGWWDDDAFLRAKADALILVPQHHALLLDFKSGKVYDRDAFQLRVEAFLTHLIYKVPTVSYSYWYVDSAERVSGVCEFSLGYHQVQDILDLMQEMRGCINGNIFIPKKNKFCKWCQLYKTPGCGI